MKKYTDDRQIFMDFEAMVEAETEDAARAIAQEMPVKVLRRVFEFKAHGTTAGMIEGQISKMHKADWVDAVVILARETHGKVQPAPEEAQPVDTLKEAYSDAGGDNSHPDEDIPVEREVDAEEGGQFEFTDELYEAYFPDGLENTPESELVELYLYEIEALNRYLARKKAEVSEPAVSEAVSAELVPVIPCEAMGGTIEAGSVFPVCPRAELADARNGYVTCTVTARTATTASLEVISASGQLMCTDEAEIQRMSDGTEYIEFGEFKCCGTFKWTARDSLIAA